MCGFGVIYALLKSSYLGISLCLCDSTRYSVLGSILMWISAIPGQSLPAMVISMLLSSGEVTGRAQPDSSSRRGQARK